ncbi:MAG: hypothetical protein KA807_01910 [Prolixibacteraceae bacterium]|nr:hypothetical protein [Prolixibacteraceae bacterium]
MRARLPLLENEESRAIALINAIQEGLKSSVTEGFGENLKKLKSEKKNNG